MSYSEPNDLLPTIPTAVEDYIEMHNRGSGPFHQTTLKLYSVPITVTDDASYMYGSVQLATLPQGVINVLGVVVKDLSCEVLSSTLSLTDGGDFGFGTAADADGTLDAGADVNLCPKTGLDPIGTAVDAQLAAAAIIDGSATALPIYFNLSLDTGDGSDIAEAIAFSATVVISWVDLGND